MKKIQLIAIFTLLSLSGFAQGFLNMGNTLQRRIIGTDTVYRFSLGAPGFWYPPLKLNLPIGTDKQVLGYSSGVATPVTLGLSQLSDVAGIPPFSNGVYAFSAINQTTGNAFRSFIEFSTTTPKAGTFPTYGTGGILPVNNGVASGDAVNVGQLNSYIPLTQKGALNGVATLGADGKVPNSQIPALAISETFVVASQAAMLAISGADQGDVAVRTDINKSFILTASPASTLGNWQELLAPTDAVQSVNGQVGNVNLTTSNINEGTNLYHTTARVNAIVDPKLALKANDADVVKLTGNQSISGVKTFNNDIVVNGVTVGIGSGTSVDNTAIGNSALNSNSTGVGNTAIGYYSLLSNTTGRINTAIGQNSLSANSTGDSNTAIGRAALTNNTTGAGNTGVGEQADVVSGNLTNATAIGYNTTVNASNKVQLGNTSVTTLGVGNTTFTGTNTIRTLALPGSGTLAITSDITSQVQNNLNPSTTLAPSVTAVNTGLALKANDADVVHKTGSLVENITGAKTFTDNISLFPGKSIYQGGGGTYPNNQIEPGSIRNYQSATNYGSFDGNLIRLYTGNYSLGLTVPASLTASIDYELPRAGSSATGANSTTLALRADFATGQTIGANITGNAATATTAANWDGLPRTAGIISPSSVGYIQATIAGGTNAGIITPANLKTALATTLQDVTTASPYTSEPFGFSDGLSAIRFAAGSGVNYIQSGKLSDATDKDLVFSGISGVREKMRLVNNGNLLIGTSADNGLDKVQVLGDASFGNSTTNNRLFIQSSTSTIGIVGATNNGSTSKNISLNAPGGNVLVGTSTPVTGAMLEVNGNITATNVLGATYNPTFTTIANVASGNAISNAIYTRVGNIVTGIVSVNVGATAANSVTEFSISLPIIRATSSGKNMGTGTITAASDFFACVLQASGNDKVNVFYKPTVTNVGTGTISFQYDITQ